MVRAETWLLRGLLGLMCVLPLWTNAKPDRCRALHTIKDQLNSSLRRRYLKHNFPINYTIQVQYEEVFRLHNISKLMNGEDVEVMDLQNLWLSVTKAGIKKILRVLPERHPTRRRYLTDLEELFRIYEQSFSNPTNPERPEFEIPSNIGSDIKGQEWRSVTPKSVLDSCYRTMHCLFKECFPRDGDEYDYCNILHWRKKNGTTPTPQPT